MKTQHQRRKRHTDALDRLRDGVERLVAACDDREARRHLCSAAQRLRELSRPVPPVDIIID